MAAKRSRSDGLERDGTDEKEMDVTDGEEEESDDWCADCYQGGHLICCDSCPRSFHVRCCGLPSVPTGDWDCRICRAQKTGGSYDRYMNAIRRNKDDCLPSKFSAINFFAAEIVPMLRELPPDTLRYEFTVPPQWRNPPRVCESTGAVAQPGYTRTFGYMGFRVDPTRCGFNDRWGINPVDSFDVGAFTQAFADMRKEVEAMPALAGKPPQQQKIMLHLPNPDWNQERNQTTSEHMSLSSGSSNKSVSCLEMASAGPAHLPDGIYQPSTECRACRGKHCAHTCGKGALRKALVGEHGVCAAPHLLSQGSTLYNGASAEQPQVCPTNRTRSEAGMARPSQVMTRLCLAWPGHARPGQARPGQTRPGQARPGQGGGVRGGAGRWWHAG